MCNLYDVGPSPRELRFPWEECLLGLVRDLTYVAPGGEGLVLLKEEGEWMGKTMRWGFARPWSEVINNARVEKLSHEMWKESWERRRCVVPFRCFYEWSGIRGSKQKHRVEEGAPERWSWMVGIWEHHPKLGSCYSVVTTPASPFMAPLHDRMPALLASEDVEALLEDSATKPAPFGGELRIDPPMGMGNGGGAATDQLELF
ncbi:MAG: SOS response-associated peptidase family protein [Verrucomicrobiota bacterium]